MQVVQIRLVLEGFNYDQSVELSLLYDSLLYNLIELKKRKNSRII